MSESGPYGSRLPFSPAGARRVAVLGLLLAAGCSDPMREPGQEPVGDTDAPSAAETPAPPPTVGLDSGYIASAFAQAAELPQLRCLIVARHGSIEREECFRGPGPDEYANIKSVSKSLLSALVGIAISEGHLSGPSQPIGPFVSEYLAGDTTDARWWITIGQLLSMQSGLERTSGANYGAWVQSRDWVRYAITRPLVAEPGTARIYSTGNSHLLSAILTHATGRSTWEYAREKLGEPMDITIPRWMTDPRGIYFGGNEMRLTPRDMVAFGELYRNGGRIGDRQVVPEEWVHASLSGVTPSRFRQEMYGYGWFLGKVRRYPYFYGQGYGGQFIFVVPDLALTVVTTSDPSGPRAPSHNRDVRSIFRDLIIPAAEIGA